MSSNFVNDVPYLRVSRQFPPEVAQLAIEVNKSYLDIANAVNNRTIGIYSPNRPSVTGESWFLTPQRRQSIRQVYPFSSTSAINHGVDVIDPNQFTLCYGSYTDGTNSYGLVFGTSVSVAGIIQFYLTSTQIIFVSGAGAPSLTNGKIVLEWMSQI